MTLGILVIWLVVAASFSPVMLRRTMRQKVCATCQGAWGCEGGRGHSKKAARVERGAHYERGGGDVLVAAWNACWWPLWLPLVLAGKALALLFGGFVKAVSAVTPRTPAERERVIREQAAEIERLTREVNGS